MDMHKKVALTLFLLSVWHVGEREGFDEALGGAIVLFAFLVPILFYRTIAYFSGFGFPEYFARDYGSANHAGPYALFFWILYLITSGFVVFEWSLY